MSDLAGEWDEPPELEDEEADPIRLAQERKQLCEERQKRVPCRMWVVYKKCPKGDECLFTHGGPVSFASEKEHEQYRASRRREPQNVDGGKWENKRSRTNESRALCLLARKNEALIEKFASDNMLSQCAVHDLRAVHAEMQEAIITRWCTGQERLGDYNHQSHDQGRAAQV